MEENSKNQPIDENGYNQLCQILVEYLEAIEEKEKQIYSEKELKRLKKLKEKSRLEATRLRLLEQAHMRLERRAINEDRTQRERDESERLLREALALKEKARNLKKLEPHPGPEFKDDPSKRFIYLLEKKKEIKNEFYYIRSLHGIKGDKDKNMISLFDSWDKKLQDAMDDLNYGTCPSPDQN
jgi:hypothetical protein